MGMKTMLLAGSLALSLMSTAALADDCDHAATPAPPSGTAFGVGYQNPGYQNADYRPGYDEAFARSHRGHGQYELQNVQRWVQGGSTQIWVNGFCHRPPFSPVQVCTQGHYETRVLPGHYETVQQWVWVPRHDGNRWGRGGEYYGRR
jgi:hypothetical protein